MPRRQYQADLQKAVEGVSIAGISEVQPGADDGEFTFMCVADGQKVRISALVPELADYPTTHEVMIFGADNASSSVAAAIDDITGTASGKTISQILELVSSRLESTDHDGDRQMLDSQELDDVQDEEDEEEEDEYFPGDEDMLPKPRLSHTLDGVSAGPHKEATAAFRQRIRSDLLIAKSEGFKVGHLGGLMEGLSCYVSLSIRISKLGISEEAMQAWQLEPAEYLVAIFHYPAGYKSMDDVRGYDAHQARRTFGVRIGICTTYKPTMQEAITAFTVLDKEEEKQREASQQADSKQSSSSLPKGFRNSFISRPLNELLEQRFHLLLKYRYGGMPWHGAESFYNDQVLNALPTTEDASHDKYYMDEHVSNAWPKVVTDDHITSSMSQEHSLPLIAMQFVLRHFVRCTEFCLICFNKMPDDLQAIKPYVCDNPLCLYQYMSLGFGPSIEHEILSQPKVVDLLVSFCYASACNNRLRDFPTGLSLAVPPNVSHGMEHLFKQQPQYGRYQQTQPVAPEPVVTQNHVALNMRYNAATLEMLFEDPKQPPPVTTGNWIVMKTDDNPLKALHCRVVDTSFYPSVRVSEPVIPMIGEAQVDPYAMSRANPQQKTPKSDIQASIPTNEFRPATFHIYNQNFDDLSDQGKRQTIALLLDLLPPVDEMKKYLARKAHSALGAWVDRLSPAAIGVLRWVIASNRACILQVDDEEDAANGRKSGDRLYGMPGWAQFRFAMGAPDKERRFIQAVRETTARLNLQYPTLFAWHGSPLQNWHGIIREGLHFNDTLHGRAFGNGVYHAPDVNTSLSYSGYGQVGGATWSRSALKIQQALALNEIVNAPKEFVSQTPHLVIAQLDWIQTRYLFVMTRTDYTTAAADPGTQPLDCVEQDPSRTPRGTAGNLVIPIHAIAASRRPKAKTTQKTKRLKRSGKSKYDPIEIDEDDAASVATLEEDRAIFDDDDDFNPQRADDSLPTPNSITSDKGKSKMGTLASFGSKIFGSKPSKPLTDYVPGTLDYSTLPMLQMPAWATSAATKRLMKDFRDIIQIQNKEPAHELGWHIEEDKIENMYQWIVELHSFDPELPLASDMKKKDVKSVVLELRFGKDYPMSPPFVRVIRPRFLSFQQGGGGHVTAGGAMCMQLLTNDGWSAVSSIESVLLQVRMAISSREPKPARLQPGQPTDYGVGEAVDAYMRACAVHGWTVPAGFKEMAYGGGSDQLSGRAAF